jgi:hypothetical protein
MPRKHRDLYHEKVGKLKAIPEDEAEAFLFDLAKKEEDAERLASFDRVVDDIVDARTKRKKGGAPRKTADDAMLVQQLMKKHTGNVRSARQEFVKVIGQRDRIGKKQARARFKKGLIDPKT